MKLHLAAEVLWNGLLSLCGPGEHNTLCLSGRWGLCSNTGRSSLQLQPSNLLQTPPAVSTASDLQPLWPPGGWRFCCHPQSFGQRSWTSEGDWSRWAEKRSPMPPSSVRLSRYCSPPTLMATVGVGFGPSVLGGWAEPGRGVDGGRNC